jgi:hypothetical protein
MTRPVLIGAGLGLLLLAAVAGTLWLTGRAPQHAAVPVSSPAVLAPRAAPAQPGGAAPMAVPAAPRAASRAQRQRLAELRAEFNALRAQGPAASPEKMRAVIDELEALSPAGLDKRYFETLRDLLGISAQVQKLSQELQGIAKSNAPQDVARREAILKEVQALGERARTQAQSLQAYVPAVVPKAKSP